MAELQKWIDRLNANWKAYDEAEKHPGNFALRNALNQDHREICQELAARGLPFHLLAYDSERKTFSLPVDIGGSMAVASM